jgi:hypothetical protein
MSRTLLDRLVKAAAGEPTATFRRRLLLERAAFQLRVGRWPVIDVAVGAGALAAAGSEIEDDPLGWFAPSRTCSALALR